MYFKFICTQNTLKHMIYKSEFNCCIKDKYKLIKNYSFLQINIFLLHYLCACYLYTNIGVVHKFRNMAADLIFGNINEI